MHPDIQGLIVVPKIADFGLVRFADEDDPQAVGWDLTSFDDRLEHSELHGGQSRCAETVGKLDRSDPIVYSLGAILYRIIAARPPFQAKSWLRGFLEQVRDTRPEATPRI